MTLNIGLIGTSSIAPPAIIDPADLLPGVTIAAVAGRTPEKAKAYAARYGIATAHPDFDALLADPGIDAVYVSLPPSHHALWTIKALRAGKHVICEKPLAMNSAEVAAMLDAAEASGKRLFEAFHSYHHPAFQTVLGWVRGGRIGQVQSIKAHFGVGFPDDGIKNQYRPELGGGTIMDMGCYPLFWARMVAGRPLQDAEVSVTMAASGVDETMEARLLFDGGITATISSAMTPETPFSSDMTIKGTDGEIVFDNPLVPQTGASLRLIVGDTTEAAPISTIPTYAYQLRDICAVLAGQPALSLREVDLTEQQAGIDLLYDRAGLVHLRSSTVRLPD